MKVLLIITLITITHSAYISRMTMNRLRAPTAFRPGVTLQRPWTHQRLVPSASFRQPYVVYRNPNNRYPVKHYPTSTRNVFINNPWKTTARLPAISPVTPEYEFLRAASAQPHTIVHNSGAIHTIPAPNLSLSEKPIVVIDNNHNIGTEKPRPTYEVTEKNPENIYQITKVEKPIGFSKPQQQPLQATPEIQNFIRNSPALQFSPDYGFSGINMPANPIVPQQFTIQQNFNGIPSQQDLVNSGADGIMITPNALYQPDPMFIQKLQNQLLQRFPSVEFIPYAAEIQHQNHQQPNQQQIQSNQHQKQSNQHQIQSNQQQHQELFLLQNEELRQPPEPFVSSESKNVIQRKTLEGSTVTLVPENMVTNATEKETTTTPKPQNFTVELITAETQPVTTTIKYVASTEMQQQPQNNHSTPIFYAQIGQNVGSVIANGFYSALNEVRAASALEETKIEKVEQPQATATSTDVTTTTTSSELPFFIQTTEKVENKTTEMKPTLGVPFSKPNDSVKVEYTLVRNEKEQPKQVKEGPVFAGQIVEASITEDHEFNQEKAQLMKRAPLRLLAVTEKDFTSTTPTVEPKYTVVKAKIPPKSKLTFDEQTGEPVLRIYASYADSPAQREAVTAKLSNMKHGHTVESWKSETVKAIDKTQGFDGNQVTQFGLKLRSRSDDYIPLFDEYDE